ncbi:MAG TPA: ArsR family transcriptional regulator [Thermopetrobacter sp.]|nr:ArsR family transcriptional regulator [Thermopetrobacter sp.]
METQGSIGGASPAAPARDVVAAGGGLVNAHRASAILKAMAHEGRLMILCALLQRDRSVSELEHILDQRQPAVSQQLARLRSEKLVATRRAGKQIIYSISDDDVRAVVGLLCQLFTANRARHEG